MAANLPPLGSHGTGVLVRTLRQGDQVRYPRKDDVCVIHYKLYLASHDASSSCLGKLIQDTRSRNLPFSFQLGSKLMAPGLEAAMERMSVGQSAMIFIPSWHAYGTTGKPPWIPPGADLIYLVDLLRID